MWAVLKASLAQITRWKYDRFILQWLKGTQRLIWGVLAERLNFRPPKQLQLSRTGRQLTKRIGRFFDGSLALLEGDISFACVV